MATKNVGAYARVAGVWEPCELLTRKGGFWSSVTAPLIKHYARVSGTWEVVGTDLERGYSNNTIERSVIEFDFSSPYFVEAGFRLLANGNVQENRILGGWTTTGGQWLDYLNAHGLWNYGFNFSDDGSNTLDTVPAAPFSTVKQLNTTYTWETALAIEGEESGEFQLFFRDFDSPEPAPTLLSFGITILADAGPFGG